MDRIYGQRRSLKENMNREKKIILTISKRQIAFLGHDDERRDGELNIHRTH